MADGKDGGYMVVQTYGLQPPSLEEYLQGLDYAYTSTIQPLILNFFFFLFK